MWEKNCVQKNNFNWWETDQKKKKDQRRIIIFQKPINTEVYPTE